MYLENTDGPHLAGQLWPPGCMSVSVAPEQMCLPKSMGNYTMYAGTRIPPAEPHRLACGFSQTGMRRTVRKLALEDKLATADEIAVMTDAEVCNLIVGKYTVVYSESEEVGLVETDRLEKYKNLVKIISR